MDYGLNALTTLPQSNTEEQPHWSLLHGFQKWSDDIILCGNLKAKIPLVGNANENEEWEWQMWLGDQCSFPCAWHALLCNDSLYEEILRLIKTFTFKLIANMQWFILSHPQFAIAFRHMETLIYKCMFSICLLHLHSSFTFALRRKLFNDHFICDMDKKIRNILQGVWKPKQANPLTNKINICCYLSTIARNITRISVRIM